MTSMNHSSSKPRATIKTVAQYAGVSVAAVSKVLRNAYGVSDALRLKVEKAIADLGYRPSMAARAMRGSTSTIGILLVEISNPFLQQIVDGVNDVLLATGYKAMFGVGQSKVTLEASLIESMISHQMDGLILVAPQIHGDDLAKYARQIPMVVIGHHEATADSFDTVNSDDQEGAAIAVQAFIDHGYRDIAMLNMSRDEPDSFNVDGQRESGYLKAMAAAGLGSKARILRVPWDVQDRLDSVIHVLSQPKRPRALFCWSDIDGIRVLEAAKVLGLRVPEDLAVIGYDNSSIARMRFVELASIDQRGPTIGSLAAETLLSRLKGRQESHHVLVPPVFVPRTSAL
jgi:LacI family transcriptional regulator